MNGTRTVFAGQALRGWDWRTRFGWDQVGSQVKKEDHPRKYGISFPFSPGVRCANIGKKLATLVIFSTIFYSDKGNLKKCLVKVPPYFFTGNYPLFFCSYLLYYNTSNCVVLKPFQHSSLYILVDGKGSFMIHTINQTILFGIQI